MTTEEQYFGRPVGCITRELAGMKETELQRLCCDGVDFDRRFLKIKLFAARPDALSAQDSKSDVRRFLILSCA